MKSEKDNPVIRDRETTMREAKRGGRVELPAPTNRRIAEDDAENKPAKEGGKNG